MPIQGLRVTVSMTGLQWVMGVPPFDSSGDWDNEEEYTLVRQSDTQYSYTGPSGNTLEVFKDGDMWKLRFNDDFNTTPFNLADDVGTPAGTYPIGEGEALITHWMD